MAGFNETSCNTEMHFLNMAIDNLGAMITYFDKADNQSQHLVTKFRNYNLFLKQMFHLCLEDWETQLADNSYYDDYNYMPYHKYHMKSMMALFSLGTAEGADIIAYIPSTWGHHRGMVVIVAIGMFVLAFMGAKVTAYFTSQTLPLRQIFENLEAIQRVMKQQKVCPMEQDEVMRYLSFVYVDTAQTTIFEATWLLNSIPPRMRIGEKQRKFVTCQSFFQVCFMAGWTI